MRFYNQKISQIILQGAGLSVTDIDTGKTPLLAFLYYDLNENNLKLFDLLLEKGIDPNAQAIDRNMCIT